MSSIHCRSRSVLAMLLCTLAACGSGGGDDDNGGGDSTGSVVVSAVIGPSGGTLATPGGASIVIPPGALDADTTIGIEQNAAGSPVQPSGLAAAGAMLAFTPHGARFAVPVTVTLPFDPGSVPSGSAPALVKTNAQNQWEPVVDAQFAGDRVTAQVDGFSFAQVVVPPLQRLGASQQWTFETFPGNGLESTIVDTDGQSGSLLSHVVAFGPTPFDAILIGLTETLLPDGLANGMVFSTADGITFGAFVEAPSARLGGTQPIGSSVDFFQEQSFIKHADDATLSFTITRVLIDLSDFNPRSPTGSVYLRGFTDLQVYGLQNVGEPAFFYAEATASAVGENGLWIPTADTGALSRIPVWERDRHFDIVQTNRTSLSGCPGGRVEMKLKRPLTFHVDLSKVDKEKVFSLITRITATTINRKGGGSAGDCQGSYAAAFLRDPQRIGGTTLFFTGLEPVASARPPQPLPDAPAEPVACVPGPGPDAEAGVLQFDAPAYAVDESPGAPQTIAITRSGGSRGAVSATLRTSDGSAVAGTHYSPLAATVFFADGELGRRVIAVPILPDASSGPDRTVGLALSQPGGCAALGERATAVLTIVDDDTQAPSPPPEIGLDPGFGSAGKVATPGFGGNDSAMALQADGKIVMAGGSTTEFVLARFNADGSPDAGFGSGGRVTTDMIAGGIVQEEARAVAIQPDGRIVVAGFTRNGLPFSFALTRYHPDGSLDTGFGAAGKVTGGITGRAFAVAIQADGRIVVAGDDPTIEQVKVARLNADGSIDASFGVAGQVTTDVAGSGDLAANLVVQPNGAILVSGDPIGGLPVGSTSLVRYTAVGSLDAGFGSGGVLTLDGRRVGEGLALQADGRIVLAGTVDTAQAAMTGFALMRLMPDGSPDTGFGDAGAVLTVVNPQGGDAARAVAIQPDGRIVAAGRSGRLNPNFAVARYLPDGSPDASFGRAGLTSADFFGAADVAENVAVSANGGIVLGGVARDQVDGYGLARFTP
ncbi:MAG: Calx-beta domain-containing protein [Burkholderiaceae bacterium]